MAVVATVNVDVTAAVLVTFADAGASEQVGKLTAPVGPVTAQVNATLPVNPPLGVVVIVEVVELPTVVVASVVPVKAKLSVVAAFTTSGSVTDSVVAPVVPVTTTL